MKLSQEWIWRLLFVIRTNIFQSSINYLQWWRLICPKQWVFWVNWTFATRWPAVCAWKVNFWPAMSTCHDQPPPWTAGPRVEGGYCPTTPRGIVAENYFASLQYLSFPESTRIFYIYKSPIYFWINLVSISPAWVHFERRLGRLTEVERVCENSAVWCASHHCLGVAASSAMLGPGRIGTRGILRGINQVRVGFVTEGSIQGKFSIQQYSVAYIVKRSEAVMNGCLHSIAQTFNE